jgi:hypothetical protein
MIRRINTTEAAKRLGVSRSAIRSLSYSGLLKATTTNGNRGFGVRLYFDEAEVDAFALGGAPAAKAYREDRDEQRAKSGNRKGRRTPVK